MSTVKSKKLQVGTDSTSSNNFTIYQPATPDGTLRIGVGNADSPTEVARFDSGGVASGVVFTAQRLSSAFTFSNNTTTKLVYDTVQFDTHSCYSTSTGDFTVPEDGYYHVDFGARVKGGGANTIRWAFAGIYINNSATQISSVLDHTSANFLDRYAATGSGIVQVNAGDTISIYVNGITSTGSPSIQNNSNMFSIQKIRGL